MVDIHNLIAAINPDIYCDKSVRSEVKSLIKEKGYLEAAEKAKPREVEQIDLTSAKEKPLKKPGLKAPIEKHKLVYDSPSQNLEPTYFWILDYLNDEFKSTEKFRDNFSSSPGSGHFSEVGQKATLMQKEAMNMLGQANTVLRSILNIVYDLKEFELKLEPYRKLDSSDEMEKASGLISLKQVWMDNVDLKRQNGSINAMAQQLDFVTLRDAFMAAESLKHLEKIDVNERVKRILRGRLGEFFVWVKESRIQLEKRFEIEKKYLRSQVNSLRLYARWIKPYLRAAKKLEQTESSNPGLVNAFNTVILELGIMGKKDYSPKNDIAKGDIPKLFEKIKMRTYTSVIVVEFNFRSIPQRVSQRGDWAFGGRIEVDFTSYGLNEDELKVLKKEMEKDDIGEVMKLIEGTTEESLAQIKEDIDKYLEPEKKEEKKEEKKKSTGTNPFSALFSFTNKSPKKSGSQERDLSKGIQKDSENEKVLRSQAIIEARDKCNKTFSDYKKAHGMAS